MTGISFDSETAAEEVVVHIRRADMAAAQAKAADLEAFLRGSELVAGKVVVFEGIPLLVESLTPAQARPGKETKLKVLAAESIPCGRCGAPLPYRGECELCHRSSKRNVVLPLVVIVALVGVVSFLLKAPEPATSPTPRPTTTPKPFVISTPSASPSPYLPVMPSPLSTPDPIFVPSPTPTPTPLPTPSSSPTGPGLTAEALREILDTDAQIDHDVSQVAARLNAGEIDIAEAQRLWEAELSRIQAQSDDLAGLDLGEQGREVLELVGLQRQRVEKLLAAARVEAADGLQAAKPLWDEQITFMQAYRQKRQLLTGASTPP